HEKLRRRNDRSPTSQPLRGIAMDRPMARGSKQRLPYAPRRMDEAIGHHITRLDRLAPATLEARPTPQSKIALTAWPIRLITPRATGFESLRSGPSLAE